MPPDAKEISRIAATIARLLYQAREGDFDDETIDAIAAEEAVAIWNRVRMKAYEPSSKAH